MVLKDKEGLNSFLDCYYLSFIKYPNNQQLVKLNQYHFFYLFYYNWLLINKQSITMFLSSKYINPGNQSLPQTPKSLKSLKQSQCYYCLMKQKFNLGKNPSENQCLQHTIAAQEKQIQTQLQSPLTIEEMCAALLQIQQSLDYLQQQQDIKAIYLDLEPFWYGIKKIDQRITKMYGPPRFTIEQNQENSKHQPLFSYNNQSNITESKQNPQQLIQQSIKTWVLYFYRILQQQQISSENKLIYEETQQMHIFKSYMERKFTQLVNEMKKTQNKLQASLQKLIYYMEVSSEKVSKSKIKQDIQFLQEHEIKDYQFKMQEENHYLMLFAQAATIEALINHHGV